MRLILTMLGVAVVACVTAGAGAAVTPVVFFDPDMADADWTLFQEFLNTPATTSHTFGQEATGGNPGSYFHQTHTMGLSGDGSPTSVNFRFLRNDWVYDPSTQGAIDHIDFTNDVIAFAGGIGSSFFILQGANQAFYRFTDNGVFANTEWMTFTVDGIDASTVPSQGSTLIDFSASGAPLTFGFQRSNTNSGQSFPTFTDHGIDNFGVTIVPIEVVTPPPTGGGEVPEPASAMLLAIGGAALLRRRRRAAA